LVLLGGGLGWRLRVETYLEPDGELSYCDLPEGLANSSIEVDI
jgi:hypothetical protein